MSQQETPDLSRRERQIMDFLFRVGRGSAADVLAGIPEPPSYSAVRAMLRILEEKGHVRHEEEGRAYIYFPTTRKETARKSALQHLLRTFFDGSTEDAVAALLDLKGARMSGDELARIEQLVEQAKREGR